MSLTFGYMLFCCTLQIKSQLLTKELQQSIYEQLGEKIKQARENAEIKQELLAKYVNLSRVSISNIEKGKQNIQLHTLLELSKYLRINLSQLLDPLSDLLIDTVSVKQEKRIQTGLDSPKASEKKVEAGTIKVKEFVNFLKSKPK